MADIQVPHFLRSTRELSKNKTTFSWTRKSCSPRRPLQEWDTTRTSDSTSKPPRKLLRPTTSTRNAPSHPMSPSEEKFSRALLSQPRCNAPSLWDAIICTTFPSTTDTRNVTPTSPPTFPPPSLSKKEISSSSESAVLFARQCPSTSLRSPLTKL